MTATKIISIRCGDCAYAEPKGEKAGVKVIWCPKINYMQPADYQAVCIFSVPAIEVKRRLGL